MIGHAALHGYARIAVCGLLVGMFVFGVCTLSAFHLYKQRVFNQENIIFGSDPYFRSYAFSQGWGERSLVHPNLSNFINPGVRVIAWISRPLVPNLRPEELRMRVSLLVSPLFSALTSYSIFVISVLANVGVVKAFSLSVLFGFSISTLAFGSVPDHFLISSFVLSTSFLLLLLDGRLASRFRLSAWVFVVTLAAGITLTNAAPLLALCAYDERRRQVPWGNAIRRTAGVGLCALLATIMIWGSFNWIYGDFSSLRPDHAYAKNFGRITRHISDNPVRDLFAFPFTVGQAFWGGYPQVVANPPYPKPELAHYKAAFYYRAPLDELDTRTMAQLLAVVLIGLSLYLGWKSRKSELLLVGISALVFISFNWLLHTFWGEELFLFSPHWHFASVIALIPLILTCSARYGTYLLLGGAILIAGHNLVVWRNLLLVLPSLALH